MIFPLFADDTDVLNEGKEADPVIDCEVAGAARRVEVLVARVVVRESEVGRVKERQDVKTTFIKGGIVIEAGWGCLGGGDSRGDCLDVKLVIIWGE